MSDAPERKVYRGRTTVTTSGAGGKPVEVERSITIREMEGGRRRVRVQGMGTGEIDPTDDADFNDQPWASADGDLHRIEGITEGWGGDRLSGGYKIKSHDGKEIAKGRFTARKRRG